MYNGTGGGAFTGCECTHLSEFVSVTVPTDAFGEVEFGSIDVYDGNLTHVVGERGGMWLAGRKEATATPITKRGVYLGYSDVATAPDSWEILNISCAQGAAPPDGAAGFGDGGDDEAVMRASGSGLGLASPSPEPTPNPTFNR